MTMRILHTEWRRNRRELGIVASEAVATVERVAAFMFTGNKAHIPRSLWLYLGLYDSLECYGWPFIDPSRINFAKLPPVTSKASWLEVPETSTFVLGQLTAIKHHFGQIVAARRALQLGMLNTRHVEGSRGASSRVHEIMKSMFIPQMVDVVLSGLKDAHTSLTSTHSGSANNEDEIALVDDLISQRESAMNRWRSLEHPFEKQ